MTKEDIKLAAMLAQIEAHKVTVKGMEAANQEREQNGQAQAYGASDFFSIANEIEATSTIMMLMAK